MKKSEIRALADEAYTILDDFECEASVERALQVLVNAPDDPESYLLMAEVAEESDRFDHALMWINRGLTHHAEHIGLLLKKASILLDGFEEIDEAFAILIAIEKSFKNKTLSVLKKDLGAPLLLEVYLLLTDCYRLGGDYNQALAHALLAKEIAPFDENALLGLATAYYELGDYDEALSMIEPVEDKSDTADFHWQKAQILCAKGRFQEADLSFLEAFKADKSRYHRPVRLDQQAFVVAFEQALLALPREIRKFINTTSVSISDVVPIDLVKESHGTISPQTCIGIEGIDAQESSAPAVVSLYQKNIENLASRREEIKDLIASALLHDLAKLVVNN